MVINDIAAKYQLNVKQTYAFTIMASAYLDLIHARQSGVQKEAQPQLRMFQSGPGGTGKTYVVRALQELMRLYGSEDRIKFTAPFGSCAALVKGSTLHSALKIRVQKKKKSLPDSDSSYQVNLSLEQKLSLEQEWQNIDVLVIDEVSLL
ncbi:hypothetical protein C8F01DRAFT_995190, partial [Mycena amicta]